MRLLLTGGAGYVGSACLRWLLRCGYDAVAYDDLSAGNARAVPEGRLIAGDIFDAARLREALAAHRCDAVLHFAALASVADSMSDPAGYYRANALGTQAVLDAMRATGVSRLVLSSTAATYDFAEPMPLAEDSPQRPQNVYGRSKLAAEWIARDYQHSYGLSCAILRYFNAAGADPDGEFGEDRAHETHLLPRLFAAVLGTGPALELCGTDWPTPDGTCVRDYVHTDDLAQAHQLVLEALQPSELRTYNVGSGRGQSVREVLAACAEVAGAEVPWRPAARRPGDPPVLVANSERIRRELGWQPRHPGIRDIAATAWQWHRRHPAGYRSKDGPSAEPAAATRAQSAPREPAAARPGSARAERAS